MVAVDGPMEGCDKAGRRDNLSPGVVEETSEISSRGALASANTSTGVVHRCIKSRLGGYSGLPPGQRCLDFNRSCSKHQHPGDVSGGESVQSFQGHSGSPGREAALGQLNGGLLPNEGGGDTFQITDDGNASCAKMVRLSQSRIVSGSHRGVPQHPRRLTIQSGAMPIRRVVTEQEGVLSDMSSPRHAEGRPDGNSAECTAASIYLADTPPRGAGHRRVHSDLATEPAPVHIPSSNSSDSDPPAVQGENASISHPDRVDVADQGVSSGVAGAESE